MHRTLVSLLSFRVNNDDLLRKIYYLECPAPTGTAVLVLSTRDLHNKPMVITFEGLRIYLINLILIIQGEVNDDLNFQYGSQTSVYDGCGFTLKGQFWYMGGLPDPRQVKKLRVTG